MTHMSTAKTTSTIDTSHADGGFLYDKQVLQFMRRLLALEFCAFIHIADFEAAWLPHGLPP